MECIYLMLSMGYVCDVKDEEEETRTVSHYTPPLSLAARRIDGQMATVSKGNVSRGYKGG